MRERFQIYRLAIPNILAGKNVISLPLKLDSDAPFSARSISFVGADNGTNGADISVSFRWKGPNGIYRQGGFVPCSMLVPQSPAGAWAPIYPEVIWPENATIEIDVQNNLGVTLTGMAVLFRGVKLFPDNRQLPGSASYPANYESTPFDLPRFHQLAETATLLNQPLNIPSDAAVVIRGALLSLGAKRAVVQSFYQNLFMRFSDCNHKYYMNDYIEVDWLLGGNCGGSMQLFHPELYMQPSDIAYYDLQRSDNGTGLGTIDVGIVWKGSKVYPRG